MFKSFFLDRRWFLWSIVGSAIILYVTWYKVQIDVEVNEWFGSFYDLIQKALAKPNAVTFDEFLAGCIEFFNIVSVYIIIAVILDFFVRHYVFRWRTAMNDYYMKHWDKISHIEGASQRVQEDTMRFARIVESLGVSFMRSLMTLVAFLPILWTLSENVTELPWIGSVDRSLVYLAIISALFGTVLLAIVGIRLPGLEFKNQKVEAAYRKELVFGEDNAHRAKPETVKDLFFNVRKNYFNLYRHYLYFDIAKWSYIQYTVIVPYIALGPAIISGALTLGVLQQILRAFGKVEESFQFLVHSWSTIVELMSIYKRLRAFEVQINDAIDVESIPVE
ncbi:peptide antibiotic transporter SbmA [Photobacterium sp. NCIMB 13483]|uniref:Peptide antibiotic transporter SbmA n=1 Tax=Photobacterium piscicola TaxID=1378299 RepID=A0A1T5HYQ2_9GAMM|nr:MULTISPECIES: peptide antibiotic transporter SbmA [Photobacterium]MEC6822132.1 peptide antibiotic transporter SbmA [Photobacterium piscicola]MEC6881023.1 peptide antibiotic transporter SbmA [Photobacterium piscicola]MEC6897471.1 peptide antibiotic transporter SbmA [Photobacterium piscicola]PST94918.1 peptide antibiotic transporter SbmA [Photobacterium sp. NCIMB 13483]SKC31959.1 Peptide antibiotic transporter SbmA [Photobacterium piscicola]